MTTRPRTHIHTNYLEVVRCVAVEILEETNRLQHLYGGIDQQRPNTVLAAWAGVSKRTLCRWKQAGEIPLYALDRIAIAAHGLPPAVVFGHLYTDHYPQETAAA